MIRATPLCHFVTSPPQGGRSGTRGYVLGNQLLVELEASDYAGTRSPSLWGRCHEVTEGGVMPHGKVSKLNRLRARRMRKTLTDAELFLWNELRAHRLMGLSFRRQMPIVGYIVDFACPAHRIIVELDGSQHATESSLAYDADRTRRLEADGWIVLRFWNDEILRDIDGVCRHILAVIDGRRSGGPVP